MSPVLTQPLPSSMSAYSVEMYDDDRTSNQCHVHQDSKEQCACSTNSNLAGHRVCHQARLRRFLLPILLFLLGVGTFLVISCASDIDFYDFIDLGADIAGSALGKRQASSNQSSFTRNKLYLIIVFVGLVLVVIAAIMLSAWCCRGAFENPLCCPCYLCACCGGLACLECIGCGLCAAGADAV